MALQISDWFGYDLKDWSDLALAARRNEFCPFISGSCTKLFHDGTRSGVCTVKQRDGSRVIICPNRLYARNYAILSRIAQLAFSTGVKVIAPADFQKVDHDGTFVVALGARHGQELPLPARGGRGGYFVDWILARIGSHGELAEFVAIEVQAIDTTGSYRSEVIALRSGDRATALSRAGLNWENVNKRILPQLIYKGHVLRREALCTKGLFFVAPAQVYQRIIERLGGALLPYDNLQPGSITFVWYTLGDIVGGIRALIEAGMYSTTVDQVAVAFTAPTNLPPAGVYASAIRDALRI